MEQDYLALAARIEAFELDEPGVVDAFGRRLARENAWSDAYTRRVVREYKRFLVLAVTSEHVVSPSEQVDQAWHVHVLHSARYRAFCRDVLGRPLDHGPSDGSSAEQTRISTAYEQTLSSYQQRFGEPPPSDVWPSARQRFGAHLAVRRVNTSEHWVLRKPRLWIWLRARLRAPTRETARRVLMTAGLGALAGGCSASLASHASGPAYLRGFLALWLLTAGAAYLVKKSASLFRSSAAPLVLQPYALAQLAGGPTMALDSAITSLIARGCIELADDGSCLLARLAVPSTAATLEHAVYQEVAREGRIEVKALRRQAGVLTQALTDELLARGLVSARRLVLPLLLALVAPVVGTVRILSRVGTDKPISHLVWLTLVATVLAFWVFRPRREQRTYPSLSSATRPPTARVPAVPLPALVTVAAVLAAAVAAETAEVVAVETAAAAAALATSERLAPGSQEGAVIGASFRLKSPSTTRLPKPKKASDQAVSAMNTKQRGISSKNGASMA
jgi:uncharacterized protein (TIGR04222 family)